MALNGFICADVPLSNYSLTHSVQSPVQATDSVARYVTVYVAHRYENWCCRYLTDAECRTSVNRPQLQPAASL